MKRAGIDPAEVEDVIFGCALPEGATGQNIARQVALRAGLPVTTGGVTVNRFCSSGMQAIAMAAHRVIVDRVPVMVAGGVESISLVQNEHFNTHRIHEPWIDEHKPELYLPMIDTAEVVAKRYYITREAQDEYALASQQRTAAGQKAGRFDAEIVPHDGHQAHAGQEHGRDARGAGDAEAGRGQPPRHVARRAREARAGAWREGPHHRRQREPALGRRLRVRGDGRQARRAAQPEAARDLPRLRGGRVRAGRDGDRAGLRGAAPARAARPEGERHRSVGAERGVRGAGGLLPRQARASRWSV